jgi:peptidyl-prolyl cis-trans isomerase B (cyclophilin B)
MQARWGGGWVSSAATVDDAGSPAAGYNLRPMLARFMRNQYAFPALILGVAAIAGIVVLIASSGGDDGGGGSSDTACKEVAAPQPKNVKDRGKPKLDLERDKTYTATVDTSCGQFVIELDTKRAPETSASFVSLAREGFYDGLGFHRIAPGFVVQGGDPNGDGTGGPGYKTREAPPDDVAYTEGVVAMAKGGQEPAGTAGSQFFVVTGPDANLPADYAVLGKVTKGIENVKAMEALASTEDGPPSEPIVMSKVTISES